MSTHSLSLGGVLSVTKRIISAHSRHFLALSVLFLLPLSFSFVLYPSFSNPPSILQPHHHRSLFFFKSPDIDESNLLPTILYSVFVLLSTLCASASITYSTFHGFYGRPVKFVSSIKSVIFSFFPLMATLVVIKLILGLIVFAFGGFTVLVYNGLALVGIEIDYDDIHFMCFVVVIGALALGSLIYLQVEWCLSNVIVVVESQWGFAPLRRSMYLVKGMRSVAFSMILLFGVLIGFLAVLCSSLVPNVGAISRGWISWAFVFQMVVYTGFMTILMLYFVAGNTVLYMYCKAFHGELAFEIAEEFASDYVSLPFDDGKVPHVVYVV